MAVITINGQGFNPSEMKITQSPVSSADAGRDQNAYMFPNKITDKWKISLAFWNPTPAETARILTAVKPETVNVQFTNPQTNTLQTISCYSGDKTMDVKWWTMNSKRYGKVSFNLIER